MKATGEPVRRPRIEMAGNDLHPRHIHDSDHQYTLDLMEGPAPHLRFRKGFLSCSSICFTAENHTILQKQSEVLLNSMSLPWMTAALIIIVQ